MHYAFICEFGTLKFNPAPTERQICYSNDGKICCLKQLLPEDGGQGKINFYESFDGFEYANLGFEKNFKAVL